MSDTFPPFAPVERIDLDQCLRSVRSCTMCGVAVAHHQIRFSMMATAAWWQPDEHRAPCGRYCGCGPIPPSVYNGGNYHRYGCCEHAPQEPEENE